ncbi:diacylglycerol O-acyltransferase 1 [Kluyveromyces marxianus]|uniref:Diacylglycerol O-acyltransferase n=1 Tax=Kluyveromyces marxianus (strain DMKU3-1042 / BCC 29191 / NBRC 104275) TaxID=1003335 RepID=W0T776_KLUMD|nr:diacylglycerol O-acyltransferase 1 [Kluyveromyces marxianus DMKU3-1042]BAO38666.1 diacylglycerol O-acyltransferase 1 [Kluyveromyces marxianus DMKU3-1042]BAP70211.1 diacylglycerol O-acyltransferase 1 [Kluyveromyces marxianus]
MNTDAVTDGVRKRVVKNESGGDGDTGDRPSSVPSADDVEYERKKMCYCSTNIPMKRRMQTLMVIWYTGSIVFMTILSLFAIVNPCLWWFVLPYGLYYCVDRTPSNGNAVKRYSPWFRGLGIWWYLRDYFPVKLYQTAKLEPTFTSIDAKELETEAREPGYLDSSEFVSPSKWWSPFKDKAETVKATGPRYIFGYHPHGVAAFGAFSAFATEACGWGEKFPGINNCLLTLVNQFQIPVYRDYLLALGITSVARKNAMKILDNNYSITIVIGGASEAAISQIGSTDIILNKRKGFVKLALQAGNVSLVPVYGFGETSCYKIIQLNPESKLRRFQTWVKSTFGFTIPVFFARGIFNYDFGLLPYRHPINVVVGKPIHIKEKIEHPTIEQIDHYHKQYIAELQRLFDEYKGKFGYGDKTLNIVE